MYAPVDALLPIGNLHEEGERQTGDSSLSAEPSVWLLSQFVTDDTFNH